MARRTPRLEATHEKTLTPLKASCEQCGQPLWVAYHGHRTVTTLSGLWKLTLVVRQCIEPTCPRFHQRYRPEEEGHWALPHGEFGLEVIALIGQWRKRSHRSVPEMHQALLARGISVAQRSVTYLMQRSEELVTLGITDQECIKARLQQQGHVILAIDWLQPDVGHEVLWVVRDCLSKEILLARPLLSSSQGDLTALLKEVKQLLEELEVPVKGVISDGEETIGSAVAFVFPGVLHQLCQFHYLKDATKPLYEADQHAKTQLKKQLRGVRPIERALEEHKTAENEAIRGYCLAVRAALTDDGRSPLQASGLRLYDRIRQVSDSIARGKTKKRLPPALKQLQQLLAKGLKATAALWSPLQSAYWLVHQAEVCHSAKKIGPQKTLGLLVYLMTCVMCVRKVTRSEESRMRTGKKFTRLLPILLCFMSMLLVDCGGGTTPTTGHNKASTDKQVYIYPQTAVADIKTFDPALSADINSNIAIDMVFTGLVQLDDNLNVRPQLAESWQESPDGLIWTFHLKPNLKFSDGTTLNSKDVAYSIDRALQPAIKSVTSPTYLALIKDSDKLLAGKIPTIINDSIMTPDANTVVIVTNKKASYFLDALTYSSSYVVEKSLIDKYGNQNFTDHLTEGGGAGPFKVSAYNHSKQIVFVPNPNYYGPKPQLQKVIMPFYKEVATAYQAYQVGQVSATGPYSFPTVYLAQARQLTKEFHLVPQLNINYYAMNYLLKPFDNIHIRQAFALSVNKSEIVHAIWKDLFIPTNHIVPQGMLGYNPNLTGPDGTMSTSGNLAKARALFQQGLQEEGWSSVSQMPIIKLTYATGQTETNNEVTAIIQMWQNVLGVSVKPNPVDFNREISEIFTNKLQFWLIAWNADYPDPQDWLTLQFDKGVPFNAVNYGQNNTSDTAQQQAVQQQLEAADVNPDQNARLRQYNQAEQQLVNDVAWMPIEQLRVANLLKPCVKGVVFNASGHTPPDDWGKVYISTDTPCTNS